MDLFFKQLSYLNLDKCVAFKNLVENVFKIMLIEGRWECYCKYIEQNYFSYFLSMNYTNRGNLAVVTLSDCHKNMTAR